MGRTREEEKREGDKRRPKGQREPREDQEQRECLTKMAQFHRKREAGGREAKKLRGWRCLGLGTGQGCEVLRNQDSVTVVLRESEAGVCLDMVNRHPG